jgi:hypothetical protein
MVREKILVVRGEIWTLFAICMFIILFHYILIHLRVNDTGSLTIFALLRCSKFMFHERESINLFQTSSNKYHTNNFVIIKQVHLILSRVCGDYNKKGIGLTTGFIGSQTVTHHYSVYTLQLTVAAATLL